MLGPNNDFWGNRGWFLAWIIVGPKRKSRAYPKIKYAKSPKTKGLNPSRPKIMAQSPSSSSSSSLFFVAFSSPCLLSLFWVLPQEEKSFAKHARRDHPGIPRQNYNPRHSLPILPDTIVCQRALFSWSNGLHWEEKWRARMLPEVLIGKVFRVSVHCSLVISVER